MIVVFDTNVVVEAIFWPRSTARRVLTGLALRRYKTAVCQEILDEYAAVTAELRVRLFRKPSRLGAGVDCRQIRACRTNPASRQTQPRPEDNCCDCGGCRQAAFLVTQDRDLLVLEKPFGVQIVTPVQLLRELRL